SPPLADGDPGHRPHPALLHQLHRRIDPRYGDGGPARNETVALSRAARPDVSGTQATSLMAAALSVTQIEAESAFPATRAVRSFAVVGAIGFLVEAVLITV